MDLWWLFTVPILKLAIKISVGLSSLFLVTQVYRWNAQAKARNPFAKDSRKPRKPYVTDQKNRNAVIKRGFSDAKVPDALDAIVIGSGIGGLTAAVILAKAGKRVLVLEQHDVAGGCCHTFVDTSYEFDVGIHYIGEMGVQSFGKTMVDQLTNGQLQWAPMEDEYDVVSIGFGDNMRKYPVVSGMDRWKKVLKKSFPDEEEAIESYFKLLNEESKENSIPVILKLLPLPFCRLIVHSGLLGLFSNYGSGHTTLDTVRGLTSNRDLRTVFCYCWGDYGTHPKHSSFATQASLMNHFLESGAYYPVGGASEIAHSMIPIIEEAGGQVLVRAEVKKIIHDGKKAMGVEVCHGGSRLIKIVAPCVISDAGVYNTFLQLLPDHVAKASYFHLIAQTLRPAVAAVSVFVGLDASHEDLRLRRQNYWLFASNEVTDGEFFDRYMAMSLDDYEDVDSPPLMFISFPSTKDPNWTRHIGRENKSTMTIVTFANWEWYKKWENEPVKRRGDDYEALKKSFGHKMLERACELFPQIRDHIDFVDVGSPVSNKYYLAQPHGEIYGLDHTRERFEPLMTCKLRPCTDVPGLYLTGQDTFMCGFMGGMVGGMLAASAVLDRNVFSDLTRLQKKLSHNNKPESHEKVE